MFLKYLLFTLLLLAAAIGVASAQFNTMMMAGGKSVPAPPPPPPQSIASITLPASYPSGSSSGYAVGSATVNMSPPSPPFTGTLAFVAPGNTTGFSVNSSTGAITLAQNDPCASSPCTIDLKATPSNGSIAPYTQSGTITSSSGPAIVAADCNAVGASNGSCFSKQVVEMDFSGAKPSFVGPSGNFDASNSANWIGSSGGGTNCAATPVFLASSTASYTPNAVPCDDYQVVTDPLDGQKSLRIEFTQADLNGGHIDTSMTSAFPGHAGVMFPGSSFYFQFQWHTDAATVTTGTNFVQAVQNGGQSAALMFTGAWQPESVGYIPVTWNGQGQGGMEWDIENHLPVQNQVESSGEAPSSYGNFYDYPQPCASWWGPTYNGTNGCSNNTEIANYNPTNSWTYIQGRATEDTNLNWAFCLWVNGTALPCVTGTWNTNSCGQTNGGGTQPCNNIAGGVSSLALYGPSDVNPQGLSITLSGHLYTYFRDIEIWTCPSSQTAYSSSNGNVTVSGAQNPCFGTVLTSNP